MTAQAAQTRQAATIGWMASILRDTAAGIAAAFVGLPICLASGALAFSSLGVTYGSAGITGGLYGAVVGGLIATLFSRSSFVISSPRASLALIQASLGAALLANGPLARSPEGIAAAMFLCVLLAGLWQIVFGALGVARIIKFTPYPVLAGFLNGVALLIILSQIKPYFTGGLTMQAHATELALALIIATFVACFGVLTKAFPAPVAGLLVGIAIFYIARLLVPGIELGPTIGELALAFPPNSPLAELLRPEVHEALHAVLLDLTLVSLALAIVATLESLLTLRVAQDLHDLPAQPNRAVIAQGFANCASALCAGLAVAAGPSQTTAAYNAGGRSRIVGVVSAVLLLALAAVLPWALAAIPAAVLCGLLLGIAFQLFDRSSLRLLGDALRTKRRRNLHDLLIVVVVMAMTASISVVVGIALGLTLSCIIFIWRMSRPVVQRRYMAPFSKRFRTIDDGLALRATADQRVVLELQGILFFGNADDLSGTVAEMFRRADVVVLDLRGISDIDLSGATILRNLVIRSDKQGKRLLFCNVPVEHASTIAGLVNSTPSSAIFTDLDSGLEWMEEEFLHKHRVSGHLVDEMSIDQHDFLRGLDKEERGQLRTYLARKEFPKGATLCGEGAPADRMLILTRGSVSVRLRVQDSRGSRRMATLPMGTITGSMALIGQDTVLLADIVCDEAVVAYELERSTFFEVIVRDHPRLAARLLMNVGRELMRRLRTTFDDFREVTS
jgi:MFS superfamily sulfate permease-like transporter